MSVQSKIERKLSEGLSPVFVEVTNESASHNVPPGSESHFKVVIVTSLFQGKALVARHRLVNALLRDELAGPVHALALHTYTPEQWATLQDSPQSPQCLGGKAREATL